MNVDENLIHFQKTAMESARAKSNSIIGEYTESLDSIFADFKAEKDRQANLRIHTESDRLTLEGNKQLHDEQLNIRRELTSYVRDLKERLFSDVSNMLEEYMETSDYEKWLVSHIKQAKQFAKGDEIIIYIDPHDEKRIYSLEEQTQTHLTVSKFSFFGGIRAVIPEKHILIDNSFESRLKEERENFTFGGNRYGQQNIKK